MELLALPLSVDPESGRLARTDAVSALLSVIRAMAGTSGSGEGPTAWFGLQEMFAEPALQRGDQHQIQARLNEVLSVLGVTWATVGSVYLPEEERHPLQPTRRFDIALDLGDGNMVHRSLNI